MKLKIEVINTISGGWESCELRQLSHFQGKWLRKNLCTTLPGIFLVFRGTLRHCSCPESLPNH